MTFPLSLKLTSFVVLLKDSDFWWEKEKMQCILAIIGIINSYFTQRVFAFEILIQKKELNQIMLFLEPNCICWTYSIYYFFSILKYLNIYFFVIKIILFRLWVLIILNIQVKWVKWYHIFRDMSIEILIVKIIILDLKNENEMIKQFLYFYWIIWKRRRDYLWSSSLLIRSIWPYLIYLQNN